MVEESGVVDLDELDADAKDGGLLQKKIVRMAVIDILQYIPVQHIE